MIIRKIEPQDDSQVAEIIRSVMTEHGAVGEGFSIEDPEVDAMHAAYSGKRATFYVLEEEGKLVGCGGLGPLDGGDPNTCELKKMYFLPVARGKGLGRLLGEMLIVDARRMAYREIYIETLRSMAVANHLYAKLGFEALDGPRGNTGHCSCDAYYLLAIERQPIDPSLLA